MIIWISEHIKVNGSITLDSFNIVFIRFSKAISYRNIVMIGKCENYPRSDGLDLIIFFDFGKVGFVF